MRLRVIKRSTRDACDTRAMEDACAHGGKMKRAYEPENLFFFTLVLSKIKGILRQIVS